MCEISAVTEGDIKGDNWINPANEYEQILDDDGYNSCNQPIGERGSFTTAYAARPAPGAFVPIQICPVFLYVDIYKSFEHTLLHEMTHSIQVPVLRFEGDGTDTVNLKYPNRQRTIDHTALLNVPLNDGGYEWRNIYWLRDSKGWNNADSYTYFAFGARLLKERGYRIRRNGCPEKVGESWNWAASIANGPKAYVDASWTLPKFKRGLHITKNTSDHEHLLKRASRLLKTPPYPFIRRNDSVNGPTGFTNTGPPVGTVVSLSQSVQTPVSDTSSEQVPSINTSTLSQMGPNQNISSSTIATQGGSSGDARASSLVVVVPPGMTSSTSLNLTTPSPSVMTAPTSLVNSVSSMSTPSGASMQNSSTAPGSMAGSASTTTTATPITSFTSINKVVEELLSSFWKQPATATLGLNTMADLFCNDVAFVRFGGGILGAVLKVASNVVNGIIDASCNIEFPVVKGGKLPKWFSFGDFPPAPGGKPQEPGDPEQPDQNEPTKSTEESKASSSVVSSCSSTAYSSCDVSRFVSGTATEMLQSCRTTSACTGSDVTKVIATTWLCSQSAIQDCRGTAFVTGGGITSFATDCSTRSACSGTGVTSIMTLISSSAMPQLPPVFDLGFKKDDEQNQCALRLAASATDEIEESEYLACFGLTVGSTVGQTSTDSPASLALSSSVVSTPGQSSSLQSPSEAISSSMTPQPSSSKLPVSSTQPAPVISSAPPAPAPPEPSPTPPPPPSPVPPPSPSPSSKKSIQICQPFRVVRGRC
ncbi:hypothetical protein CC86DRAFT_453919 [Ophiobolus disseminans]|uniref:Uncharacterized protein n=1 Tax=Ophiobolus disseminans TaxID=1469910 RepID=A0A6A7A975_9PLEO|nr:hypothetical protein CC86DRAFT_453919 [Ophiobolus disseminans]